MLSAIAAAEQCPASIRKTVAFRVMMQEVLFDYLSNPTGSSYTLDEVRDISEFYFKHKPLPMDADCGELGIYSGEEIGTIIKRTDIAGDHEPSDCDDGLYCNWLETEDARGGCVAGIPVDCSPFDLPTVARCDHDPDNNPYTLDYAA